VQFINKGFESPGSCWRTDSADVLKDFDFESFLSESNTKVADFHWEPLVPESEVPAINKGHPPPTETPTGTQTNTDVEKDTTIHHEVQEHSVSPLCPYI